MAESNLAAAAISVAAGAFVVVLGYLVRYRGATHLVSGYHPDRIGDEALAANLVDGFAILVGVATAALGGAMAVVPLDEPAWGRIWFAYSALLLVGVVALNVLGRRRPRQR